MYRKIKYCIALLFLIPAIFFGQEYRDAEDTGLFVLSRLSNSSPGLNSAYEKYISGDKSNAKKIVVEYFAAKMSERYYFDWRNVEQNLEEYTRGGTEKIESHARRASEMMELYYPDNNWNLPMESKTGRDISVYELRHLARQHKAVDIAFTCWFDNEKEEYLNYISEMVNSLEKAYINHSYEDENNGVFESFRAGYRIFNWLFIYNLLQGSDKFTIENKFNFIKAFYYHALEEFKETRKFRYGNHHTKGVMALAQIALLFPEFEESNSWREHAVKMLTEHLEKEINPDGFQFERSIHYHIGDIDNYFYIYYLAKINGVQLPEAFGKKLYKMFEALTKLAYPNLTLPVLQDDTDNPWAEFNNMKGIMTLGALLFNEGKFKYFAADKILSDKFWFVRESDKKNYAGIKKVKPEHGSVSLPETGYYSMRNGWDHENLVVTVSAGKSEEKPDHQHGDMLGLQLYAYDNYMLPNYQVRYYLDEYKYFKNSFVKNICVVDSIPQGREWKGNSGGSGFGKFNLLPEPEVLKFHTTPIYDLFSGKLNYESTDYYRTVIFIKSGFVVVIDKLSSDKEQRYSQIWQGYYSRERENLFRSTFNNGSGLDIIQLNNYDGATTSTVIRGKSSLLFHSPKTKEYKFITILYPFSQFDTRVDERKSLNNLSFLGFGIEVNNDDVIAEKIIGNGKLSLLFNAVQVYNLIFSGETPDIIVNSEEQKFTIISNGEYFVNKENEKIRLESFKEYMFEDFKR